MKGIALSLFFVFIVCASCDSLESWLDMDQPEVVEIFPGNRCSGVEFRPLIYVRFSEEMDKPKTEESFRISSDSGTPGGFFRWDGDILYYDLIEDLRNGGVYTVSIGKEAEDINGNNIIESTESRFSVGDDFNKPFVVSTSPEDGASGVDETGIIRITFSEQVSLSSAEKGFSILPFVCGVKALSDDGKTLIFIPYSGFDNKTEYTVSLSLEITDIAGNPLLENRVFSFLVGDDFTEPTLDVESTSPRDEAVGVFADSIRLEADNLTDGVEKDSVIRIVFSESMKRLETSDAISVTPFVDYSLNWADGNRTVSIRLSDGECFAINNIYKINIHDSAVDLADNRIDGEYAFSFRINGESSQALSVIELKQMQWLADGTGPDEGRAANLLVPDAIIKMDSPPDGSGYSGDYYGYPQQMNDEDVNVFIIRVVFRNSSDSNVIINGMSILDSIGFRINVYYGNGDENIRRPVILKTVLPFNSDVVDIYIYNLVPSTYYELEIEGGKGGVLDENGNYMLETYRIFLNC